MKKVMVIDDDNEFLEEITELLNQSGYETIALSRSDDVLMLAALHKPNVILLDLQIVGGSGFKTADELRNNSQTKNIPTIAITGVYKEEVHKLPAKFCGFRKFLIKPVTPLDIIDAIEEVAKK